MAKDNGLVCDPFCVSRAVCVSMCVTCASATQHAAVRVAACSPYAQRLPALVSSQEGQQKAVR